MDTFYCIGCRFAYPVEKAARITPAAHRDGQPVGFCFVCVRDIAADDVQTEVDATAVARSRRRTATA